MLGGYGPLAVFPWTDDMKLFALPEQRRSGEMVAMRTQYGPVARRLVTPFNPNTAAQAASRALFAAITRSWAGLTDAQRCTWQVAAGAGLCGPGLYVRVNVNLAMAGLPGVQVAPVQPVFPEWTISGMRALVVGAETVLLLDSDRAVEDRNILVYASAAVSAGRCKNTQYTFLGVCPCSAGGVVDLTELYLAKFKNPPLGSRVFVRTAYMINGYKSLSLTWSAIVEEV